MSHLEFNYAAYVRQIIELYYLRKLGPDWDDKIAEERRREAARQADELLERAEQQRKESGK